MDLQARWAERRAAWRRYEAWSKANPVSMPVDQALASIGALLRQFPPAPGPDLTTDEALRESIRGHLLLRACLSRLRGLP
jgi:hypothetical protein